MKFTYLCKAQSSTTSPLNLFASSSPHLFISQLIRQLRNSRRKGTIIEGTGLDTQDETDSCSLCNFGTCSSPCWVRQFDRHYGPAVNMATCDRGSDRATGEISTRGRRSEETTGQKAIDAEFWVPEWARLCAAASEEQRGGQRVAAAEQGARATGMIRGELMVGTPIINGISTEDDEDALLALWVAARTRATPEILAGKVQPGTLPAEANPWSTENTFFGAYTSHRPRPNFATLPIYHNAGAHELLISPQWTRFTDDGSVFRPHASAPTPEQPPTLASRLNDWREPGGTHRLVSSVSEKVGNWLHIRKFALQSRIGERRIWLREKFDRERSTRVRESEQGVRDEGSLVNVTIDEVADNGLVERNLKMAEGVERVPDGEVFGFERCRTRQRVDTDTGLRENPE